MGSDQEVILIVWILSGVLAISVIINIILGVRVYGHKVYDDEREKDIRVLFNTLETEVRTLKNKYGLNK